MEEYSPRQQLLRLVSYWWLILLAALLGGAGGFLFSLVRAPVYEARAVYVVSVDLTRIPNPLQPLEQLDEDLALASTQAALLDPGVLQAVVDEASKQAIPIDRISLLHDSVIERRGVFWDLRYHSTNPHTAQIVANLWAVRGYELMLEMQSKGQVPPYVIFNPPQLADIPQAPIDYARTRLILAGGVVGLILGILSTERFSPSSTKTQKS